MFTLYNNQIIKLKLLTSYLISIKIMLLKIVKKYLEGLVKIFFGQSKIHVRYLISLIARVSCVQSVYICFFLHYIPPYPQSY